MSSSGNCDAEVFNERIVLNIFQKNDSTIEMAGQYELSEVGLWSCKKKKWNLKGKCSENVFSIISL